MPRPTRFPTPRFPTRLFLTAMGVLLTVSVVGLPATGQGEEYPNEGYTRVVDITFPLSGDASYTDTYFDSRGGGTRLHRATDIIAEKMAPVHAVADGAICKATGIDEPMPHYGYALTLCGDDGLEYSYIHLNNDSPGTDDGMGGPENAYAPGIAEGVRVTRGQHIAYNGDSGNAEATVDHVHFEIYDPEMTEQEGRLNPYPSLVAAEDRGDYPDAPAPMPSDAPTEPTGPTPEPVAPTDPSPDPTTEPADPGVMSGTFTRLAGATRLETAVALSQSAHVAGSARAVIVVPADSHVEALVAAPLAGLLDAPILLSGPDGLAPVVAVEIERLGPDSAYVIGSHAQLGEQVTQDLKDAGVVNQARIEAENRYALSAAVAAEVLSYPTPAGTGAILALGDAEDASRAWPDALSASAWAARTNTPVLLTEGDRLPQAVRDFLDARRPALVSVVGGTAAITEEVAVAAADAADAELRRLAGPTRYGTSVAVADAAREAGLDDSNIWVATGRNFPDALAAGPAAALSRSPLVLIDGLDAAGAPSSAGWLADQAEELVVVGGTAVISDEVAENLSP